ncbi:hypothetical protein L7F22_012214 [Adiantum nelumboides]|nr:hypothetical protein [Adiantum nelumboides]
MWCDSHDHEHRDCEDFNEAYKKNIVFWKDNKIHLKATGEPICVNFEQGGMKKLIEGILYNVTIVSMLLHMVYRNCIHETIGWFDPIDYLSMYVYIAKSKANEAWGEEKHKRDEDTVGTSKRATRSSTKKEEVPKSLLEVNMEDAPKDKKKAPIVEIQAQQGAEWKDFNKALKEEYFLEDSQRLSATEQRSIRSERVELFVQVVDARLEKSLEQLLEDASGEICLTSNWKRVFEVVSLIFKCQMRVDKLIVTDSSETSIEEVKDKLTTLKHKLKEPVLDDLVKDYLSMYVYIAKSKANEAWGEEKRKRDEDTVGTSKRATRSSTKKEEVPKSLPEVNMEDAPKDKKKAPIVEIQAQQGAEWKDFNKALKEEYFLEDSQRLSATEQRSIRFERVELFVQVVDARLEKSLKQLLEDALGEICLTSNWKRVFEVVSLIFKCQMRVDKLIVIDSSEASDEEVSDKLTTLKHKLKEPVLDDWLKANEAWGEEKRKRDEDTVGTSKRATRSSTKKEEVPKSLPEVNMEDAPKDKKKAPIVEIQAQQGAEWKDFNKALKEEYFLEDSQRLSATEQRSIRSERVELFVQVVDARLEKSLKQLLEDASGEICLTSNWKRVFEVVSLIFKCQMRVDKLIVTDSSEASDEEVRDKLTTLKHKLKEPVLDDWLKANEAWGEEKRKRDEDTVGTSKRATRSSTKKEEVPKSLPEVNMEDTPKDKKQVVPQLKAPIVEIQAQQGAEWKDFNKALKEEYFLEDSQRLSATEQRSIRSERVELFVQVVDARLEKSLKQLLEDASGEICLTSNWKRVFEVVSLIFKCQMRVDKLIVTDSSEASDEEVRDKLTTLKHKLKEPVLDDWLKANEAWGEEKRKRDEDTVGTSKRATRSSTKKEEVPKSLPEVNMEDTPKDKKQDCDAILSPILKALVKPCEGHIGDWLKLLPFALWAGRTTHTSVTGFMPFELMHGQKPILPLEEAVLSWTMLQWEDNFSTDDLLALRICQLEHRQEDIEQTKEKLKVVRLKNKAAFDNKH